MMEAAAKHPRKRKRQRGLSIEGEIRRTAKQIHQQGLADAMKAAALMIVLKKLDEIKAILMATGVNASIPSVALNNVITQPIAQPSSPAVLNPCVHCGRPGVYKSKPNQWNRTGSWFCRTHAGLAGQIENEDRFDRTIQPQAAPAPPPALQPAPVAEPPPGASSLSEAMGLATVIDEGS